MKQTKKDIKKIKELQKKERNRKELDNFIREVFGSSEFKILLFCAGALWFIYMVNTLAINEFKLTLPMVTRGRRGKILDHPYPDYLYYPTITFVCVFIIFQIFKAVRSGKKDSDKL